MGKAIEANRDYVRRLEQQAGLPDLGLGYEAYFLDKWRGPEPPSGASAWARWRVTARRGYGWPGWPAVIFWSWATGINVLLVRT